MKDSIKMVEEFHKKYNQPIGSWTFIDGEEAYLIRQELKMLGRYLLLKSLELEAKSISNKDKGDVRLFRAHLMIEELGELLVAMADEDETKILDGLVDVLYTVIGTGVTYDLPLGEGFKEVHRSNMTKPQKSKDNPRMRNKSGYSPPDLKSVLEKWREERSSKCQEQ